MSYCFVNNIDPFKQARIPFLVLFGIPYTTHMKVIHIWIEYHGWYSKLAWVLSSYKRERHQRCELWTNSIKEKWSFQISLFIRNQTSFYIVDDVDSICFFFFNETDTSRYWFPTSAVVSVSADALKWSMRRRGWKISPQTEKIDKKSLYIYTL